MQSFRAAKRPARIVCASGVPRWQRQRLAFVRWWPARIPPGSDVIVGYVIWADPQPPTSVDNQLDNTLSNTNVYEEFPSFLFSWNWAFSSRRIRV